MPSCSRPPAMRSADAGVLRHVERILVAHVDHRGADLDPLGLGAGRGQERERRAELAGEVMHPEVGAVGAERFGRHRKIDRLQQRVGRRARLRLRRRRPMAERQEADFFHCVVTGGRGGSRSSRCSSLKSVCPNRSCPRCCCATAAHADVRPFARPPTFLTRWSVGKNPNPGPRSGPGPGCPSLETYSPNLGAAALRGP